MDVEVRWALGIPPGKSRVGIEQDIFLLWPGEVTSPLGPAKKDDALARYVEARGFTVLNSGRLPLYAQNLYAEGAEAAAGVERGLSVRGFNAQRIFRL